MADFLPWPHPVGIVGAGNMGGGMVQRLRGLDLSVGVCDLDPVMQNRAVQYGATVLATPKALAQSLGTGPAVLMVVVVDQAQTEAVLWGPDGAAQALGPGQTVWLCPTLGPADVEAHAKRLTARGIGVLDAPMSGGPARAAAGTMSLMVAGAESTWQVCAPLLARVAQPVFRIGECCGDAARTKLINNLLASIHLVGAAEALALAERMGLDAGRTLSVIEASSGQSWVGTDRMRRALAGQTTPLAHVRLLAKDTRLALQAAADLPDAVQPVLGQLAAGVFARCMALGLEDQDDSVLLAHLREFIGRAP